MTEHPFRRLSAMVPRRRTHLIALVAGFVLLATYAALPAFAVHDEKFQLDGDVLASTTTNVGGNLQPFDWDSLFDSAGAEKTLPAGTSGRTPAVR
jgi:hypothetical protein